jgi:hypothetical protein
MALITLRNDFHTSACRVRATIRREAGSLTIRLTPRQMQRTRRELCGVADCRCPRHESGIRGPQCVGDDRLTVLGPND